MNNNNHKIGILAYGSLIDDPGVEIAPLVVGRIECKTPFNVEFARISSTRDNAPTLIPVKNEGSPIEAVILVLKDNVSLEVAESMLWRRETRTSDTTKIYQRPAQPNKNSVLVESLSEFHNVETVLYTSIRTNMGIMNTPEHLAYFAIKSALAEAGDKGMDGISYLIAANKNGIITKKSADYEQQILISTGTKSLEEAAAKLSQTRPRHIKMKKELDQFENEITNITDLVCDYGYRKTLTANNLNKDSFEEYIKANNEEFFGNVHEGFKLAQVRIISVLKEIEEKREATKKQLKGAHISKNKPAISELKHYLEDLDRMDSITRHLTDTIAFQMLGGEISIMRRLYLEVEGNKSLSHSNLESVLKIVEDINANPSNMALVTDLTGYIQTGDLLCLIDGNLILGEVKEGKKNMEILEILKNVQKDGHSLEDAKAKYNLDDHGFLQLKRNARQHEVMNNITEIINTDQGMDPISSRPIKIFTPNELPPKYDSRLIRIKEELDKNNLLAYDVIEDCLHIGMFKGPFMFTAPQLFNSLYTKGEEGERNFIPMDLLNIVDSINTPIFFLPFPKEFILNIIFCRVKLLFILDLDEYMKLYPPYGLTAEWGSRKETMRAKEIVPYKGLFTYKNQGIKVKIVQHRSMWLMGGTFHKIFFDHIYPSYTAYSSLYYLDPNFADDEKEGEQA